MTAEMSVTKQVTMRLLALILNVLLSEAQEWLNGSGLDLPRIFDYSRLQNLRPISKEKTHDNFRLPTVKSRPSHQKQTRHLAVTPHFST
jgi:hypothetical protein